MTDADALGAGYDAYWEGTDQEDNPYDPDREPKEHLAWLQGWCKAREHDYDESDG